MAEVLGGALPEMLDLKAVAKILGCSVSHVSNILAGKFVDRGLPPIPHTRAGRKRIIRRTVLMKWIEDQEAASVSRSSPEAA